MDYALLQFFVQNENRTVESEVIYEKVWGQRMADDSQALIKAVSRLRKKLSGSGCAITMTYGNGYRFISGNRFKYADYISCSSAGASPRPSVPSMP
jgi:DNA-binding response OmpR family regulator